MTTCTVPACGTRTDTNLCNRHVGKLRDALEKLPADLRELDTTIIRQDRGTGAALYAVKRANVQRPGIDYDEGTLTLVATPWPLSWDAADLRWRIESTIVTWAAHLLEARGIRAPHGPTCRRCTHDSCTLIHGTAKPGRFLLDHLDSIRLDEAADQIYDEITSCHYDARRAIDRQDPDVFAGRCTATDVHTHTSEDGTVVTELSACGTDLYAHTGDDEVKCPTCGTVYVLAVQRESMRTAADDVWARPHLIANALTDLDEPLNVSTLRTWIERDRKAAEQLHGRPASRPLVLQVGIDDDGAALFRVGDVRARIAWAREHGRGRMSA